MSMVMLTDQNMTFVYRVAAAILDHGRILLHRAETDQFWALPGGRCELMEPSIDAVCREMREDIGIEVRADRLLWAAEVFFSFAGKDYHELDFIYLCRLPENCPLAGVLSFPGDEEGLPLIFQWFDIEDLEQHEVYPTFLRQGLRRLPQHPVHIITRENYQ